MACEQTALQQAPRPSPWTVYAAGDRIRWRPALRRSETAFAMALAMLVLLNTVYGRYHYSADGLAGLVVSLIAFALVLVHRAYTARRQA